MQLRFITRDTKLDVQVGLDVSRTYSETIFPGTFIGADNDFSCTIECDMLFGLARRPQHGDYIKVSFHREADTLHFEARINKVFEDLITHKQQILLTVISDLETTSRRKELRIQVSVPVSLHLANRPIDPNDYVLKGTTLDISNSGICVLSNERLDTSHDNHYVVQLHLPRGSVKYMPMRHMRSGDSPLVQLSREHIFLWNDSISTEEIKEFIYLLFKLRLDGLL